MPDYRLVIIGAGLSGLAAGIRAARFGKKTLIVEQHRRAGGLNSWYTRHGRLLETGLHAMTNFAPPEHKKAPLNLLFRQLKLSRRDFPTREQIGSEIAFPFFFGPGISEQHVHNVVIDFSVFADMDDRDPDTFFKDRTGIADNTARDTSPDI